MSLKPFAISEISDPSQVRVVLYSGGGFVHAPLNGVFDLLKAALKTELDGSLKDLEKRLEALREEFEDLKECSLDEVL
ncbi:MULTISPECIES: hypothetical protein [Bartonella]|uniref:Uncharacterized protein n=2 Tax=Bartonella TaxID=773 RepID=A0A336NDM7_BARGR|nr:hypothetical protein [Bartonella grahamii]SSZ40545.1 Uncharacterised protein [Bartonella grahamii]SSZ40848.1 Uncharacterised protein [Bartonella grahamii]